MHVNPCRNLVRVRRDLMCGRAATFLREERLSRCTCLFGLARVDNFFYRFSEPAGKKDCLRSDKKEDIDANASRISGEVVSLNGSLWLRLRFTTPGTGGTHEVFSLAGIVEEMIVTYFPRRPGP